MATAGSQGKATAPPAGHARDRPGASKLDPRDAERLIDAARVGGAEALDGRSPTYGQTRTSGARHEPGATATQRATASAGLERASERRMPAVPRAIPTGRASDQQMPCAAACRPAASSSAGPPRRRPVPVTTDALVGADEPCGAARSRPAPPRQPAAGRGCTSARPAPRRWPSPAVAARPATRCTVCRTRARARLRWRSSTRTGVRRRGRLVRDGIGWRLTPRARTRPGPARTSPPGACAPEC
jgi:hypothetical protein